MFVRVSVRPFVRSSVTKSDIGPIVSGTGLRDSLGAKATVADGHEIGHEIL